MTLRQYLFALCFGTLAALAAAIIVIVGIDPYTAGQFAFFTLYVTLFAASTGILTIAGTLWRMRTTESDDVGNAVARSLRQGIFLSLLSMTALFLSAHGFLTLWTVLLLVAVVTIVEFLFLSTKKS